MTSLPTDLELKSLAEKCARATQGKRSLEKYGWAIGWQEAVQATVDHIQHGMHYGFEPEEGEDCEISQKACCN